MNPVTISSIEMQLEGSTRSLSTGKVYNNKVKQNKYDYNHLDEKAAYKKHAAAKIARKQGKKNYDSFRISFQPDPIRKQTEETYFDNCFGYEICIKKREKKEKAQPVTAEVDVVESNKRSSKRAAESDRIVEDEERPLKRRRGWVKNVCDIGGTDSSSKRARKG
jgi:hypothetical protein